MNERLILLLYLSHTIEVTISVIVSKELIKHNVRGTYSSVRGMNERLKSICAESPPYILKESIITCPSQKQKESQV